MRAPQPEFEHEGWPSPGVAIGRNGGLMNASNNAQQFALMIVRNTASFVVTGIAGLSSNAIHH